MGAKVGNKNAVGPHKKGGALTTRTGVAVRTPLARTEQARTVSGKVIKAASSSKLTRVGGAAAKGAAVGLGAYAVGKTLADARKKK